MYLVGLMRFFDLKSQKNFKRVATEWLSGLPLHPYFYLKYLIFSGLEGARKILFFARARAFKLWIFLMIFDQKDKLYFNFLTPSHPPPLYAHAST